MGNSQNRDKRTARRENRDAFMNEISNFRTNFETSNNPFTSRNLRVIVRRRPIFEPELARGEFDVLSCGPQTIVVHEARMHPDMVRMNMTHHFFQFDRVFSEKDDNPVVYEEVQPLVDAALEGSMSTIFMFGQTGSGKTYTMTAIYDRAAADICAGAEMRNLVPYLSVFELSGSRCRDLLAESSRGGGGGGNSSEQEAVAAAPGGEGKDSTGAGQCGDGKGSAASSSSRIKVLTDGSGTVHVRGCVEVAARDGANMASLIAAAMQTRLSAATGVHDQSSRTHAICRIRLLDPSAAAAGAAEAAEATVGAGGLEECGVEDAGGESAALPCRGSLFLVDLAGSERSADSAEHNAARRAESAKINRSLMALKECVRAQAVATRDRAEAKEGSSASADNSPGEEGEEKRPKAAAAASRAHRYIPYRDSQLTQLLKNAFVLPTARTVVIATVSPSAADTEHSLNTLRHASLMDGKQLATIDPAMAAAAGRGRTSKRASAGVAEGQAADSVICAERTVMVAVAGVAAAHKSRLACVLPARMDGPQSKVWWARTAQLATAQIQEQFPRDATAAIADAPPPPPASINGKLLSRYTAMRYSQALPAAAQSEVGKAWGAAMLRQFREETAQVKAMQKARRQAQRTAKD